ncbi:MAG: SEC-C domain-containing protein [Planctomycetes bacterium]|nr:SEC-C domain-containing protein [Planctomycetota bacterium]
MLDLQQVLANLLSRLVDVAVADPTLHDDYGLALTEFFPHSTPDRAALGRFHEWFLFEHRPARLGDSAVYLLFAEKFRAKLSSEDSDLFDELGANRFGVFEKSEGGVFVEYRDLLSNGLFPIEPETEDALSIQPDLDALVVTRLYPTGTGTYLVSPHALIVLDDVANALRRDLTSGDYRHGRLSQLLMERLLFSPAVSEDAKSGAGAPRIDDVIPQTVIDIKESFEEIETQLTHWLASAEIEGLNLDEVRDRFNESSSMGDAVTSLLDEIAFESDVELETGRRLLPAYYSALRAKADLEKSKNPPKPSSDELAARAGQPCRCGSGLTYKNCCLQKDAVARFEAGRERGVSLNSLIAELAAAMGVEVDEDADDEDDNANIGNIAPLPCAAPMIAEYLWEMEQCGVSVSSEDQRVLARFGKSLDGGAGAPEDLADVLPEHLLRFFALEQYTGDPPPSAQTIRTAATALLGFSKWLLEAQEIDWTSMLHRVIDSVSVSAERLHQVNVLLHESDIAAWNRAFVVSGLARFGGQYELVLEPVDDPAVRGRLQIPARLGDHLQTGDCLLVASDPEEGGSLPARLLRVLPSQAKPYLSAQPRRHHPPHKTE